MPVHKPAKTVVYRHPCDCASASRPLNDGEHPEHRFDVDGKPFPWHIAEEGPAFTRVMDDLWLIDVTIYGIAKDDTGQPRIPQNGDTAFSDMFGTTGLTIAGIEFPWCISTDGITYRHSHKTLPTVTLAFLAENVDTDSAVDDLRHIDDTIVDNNGAVWHLGAQEKALRDKIHEATKDWPKGRIDETGRPVDATTYEDLHDDYGHVIAIVAQHPDGRKLRATAEEITDV